MNWNIIFTVPILPTIVKKYAQIISQKFFEKSAATETNIVKFIILHDNPVIGDWVGAITLKSKLLQTRLLGNFMSAHFIKKSITFENNQLRLLFIVFVIKILITFLIE